MAKGTLRVNGVLIAEDIHKIVQESGDSGGGGTGVGDEILLETGFHILTEASANAVIQANTGDNIVIREDDGTAVLTVDTNGRATFTGDTHVGTDDVGHDVKFFGATSGAYMLWDESQDDLIVGGAGRVGIGTTAPAVLAHAHSTTTTALYLTTESNSSGDVEIWLGHNYPTSGDWANISFDTGDNLLKLNNSASAADVQFVINDSGDVGIGVAPLATHSTLTSLRIGGNAFLTHATAVGASASLEIGQNTHYDTDGSWEYISTDEATRYTQFAGDHIFFGAASGTAGDDITWTEGLRIKVDGKVGIGTTAPGANLALVGTQVMFEKVGADANPIYIDLRKTRHASSMGNTALSDNDVIGHIRFMGDDGNSAEEFASIKCLVNGTVGNADTPGELQFYTTPDSSATPAQRMTIMNSGKVGIGTNDPGLLLEVNGNSTGGILRIRNADTSDQGEIRQIGIDGDRFRIGTSDENPSWACYASSGASTGIRFAIHDGTADRSDTYIHSNGTLYVKDGTVGNSSDIRVKDNIEDLDQQESYDLINSLRPVSYYYNKKLPAYEPKDDTKKRYGFIADEVMQLDDFLVEIEPEASMGTSPYAPDEEKVQVDDFKHFPMHKIIPQMVNTIKVLSAKVKALENA